MRKQAFTLLEIMMVVVIVGVLSALALPQLTRTVEMRRADNAVNQMNVIAGAVTFYGTNRSAPDCSASCNTAAINSGFELEIRDPAFQYSVVCPSGTATPWTVQASRFNGPDYTLTITNAAPHTVTCSGSKCSLINR